MHSLQETIEVLPLIMGALALLLSGALVTNTMSALLAQQIDQIGMLKAIGADTRLIRRIYNQTVLAYGLLGLAIGDRLRASSAIGWRVSWQPISISTSARRALPGWHWV